MTPLETDCYRCKARPGDFCKSAGRATPYRAVRINAAKRNGKPSKLAKIQATQKANRIKGLSLNGTILSIVSQNPGITTQELTRQTVEKLVCSAESVPVILRRLRKDGKLIDASTHTWVIA
jgi:hypothetical protein